MTYYKVKEKYDGLRLYKKLYSGHYEQDGFLIANELYTQNEFSKLAISEKFFDIIELPKSKVYFFFGARFKMEE